MAAGKYKMLIDQGADYKIILLIKDSLNAPVDLTGHVFRGQIRKSVSDEIIQASFTFNVLDQITDKGKVEVLLSDTASSAIVIPKQKVVERIPVEFTYDIESQIGTTDIRWLEGIVSLNPEVTK